MTAEFIDKVKALVAAVDLDSNGRLVAGRFVGGGGGLLSTETLRAADNVRLALSSLGSGQWLAADSVPMPASADMAVMMGLLAESWLKANAPERLRKVDAD